MRHSPYPSRPVRNDSVFRYESDHTETASESGGSTPERHGTTADSVQASEPAAEGGGASGTPGEVVLFASPNSAAIGSSAQVSDLDNDIKTICSLVGPHFLTGTDDGRFRVDEERRKAITDLMKNVGGSLKDIITKLDDEEKRSILHADLMLSDFRQHHSWKPSGTEVSTGEYCLSEELFKNTFLSKDSTVPLVAKGNDPSHREVRLTLAKLGRLPEVVSYLDEAALTQPQTMEGSPEYARQTAITIALDLIRTKINKAAAFAETEPTLTACTVNAETATARFPW